MARLLCTIWALLFNAFGLPIFQTCFDNATLDEEGESLLLGPPLTSLFFSLGVYIIIVNSKLFPQSFREPKAIFLVIYEFLATAFLIEFAMACIWTPIDVLILSTVPKSICHLLNNCGLGNTAKALLEDNSVMPILSYVVSLTFLCVVLHITDSVDFTILRDCGGEPFFTYLKTVTWERIQREFPKMGGNKACRCKTRRRHSSNSGTNK